MSDRPTPLTFDPYPWNQNGPKRSHQPEVMYHCDDGEWIKLDDFRELERQLAAATEEREQMGKQAHANACEAMSYRRQLTEARTALKLIIGKNSMLRGYSAEEAASDAKQALARIDEK